MRAQALPAGLQEASREFVAQARAEQEKYGQVRPIISAEFQGQRFVAVGDQLLTSDDWKTFADFLFDYPKILLGREWGQAELKKPEDKRHEILLWHSHVCNYQKLQKPGEDGIYAMNPDGITTAYLLLAYDLYILRHHQRLQEKVVDRLKHADQFQGARYELCVAATLIRAGCDVEYEDESDPSVKHPELVATHRASGESFDVEAKSRHRAGVLGYPGQRQGADQLKVGVHRELNRACAKARNRPFVAFIDVNLPPERVRPTNSDWLEQVKADIVRMAFDAGGTWPFSLVIVTNHSDHYREFGETQPGRLHYILEPLSTTKNPFNHGVIVDDIDQALRQYGQIPSVFPDDFSR